MTFLKSLIGTLSLIIKQKKLHAFSSLVLAIGNSNLISAAFFAAMVKPVIFPATVLVALVLGLNIDNTKSVLESLSGGVGVYVTLFATFHFVVLAQNAYRVFCITQNKDRLGNLIKVYSAFLYILVVNQALPDYLEFVKPIIEKLFLLVNGVTLVTTDFSNPLNLVKGNAWLVFSLCLVHIGLIVGGYFLTIYLIRKPKNWLEARIFHSSEASRGRFVKVLLRNEMTGAVIGLSFLGLICLLLSLSLKLISFDAGKINCYNEMLKNGGVTQCFTLDKAKKEPNTSGSQAR